jgi:hypothetical protein
MRCCYPYQAGCMQLLLFLPGRRMQLLLFFSGRKYTAAAFLAKYVGSTRSMQLLLSSFGWNYPTAAIPIRQEACAAAILIRQKHATAAISIRQDACSCCFLHQVRSTISMQLLLSSSGRKQASVVIPIRQKAYLLSCCCYPYQAGRMQLLLASS